MNAKEKLIEGLNQDLAKELGTAILYLHQTATATGWDGEELREFLSADITGEMQHAIFLANKIAALGGVPTMQPVMHKSPTDVRGMLEYDLKLEHDAINSYRARIAEAEAAGEIALKTKLEELIVDETDHAEQLNRIIKGF